MLRVTVGSGVKVAVGGNQTVVAVGFWVGGGAVLLGRGSRDVDTGRQAVRPARQNIVRPAQNIQRTLIVYYGKSILGKYRHARWKIVQKLLFLKIPWVTLLL
jgi:hypothetical protein